MSSIQERIRKVMDRYSLSIKDLAEACEVQRSAVSHILNGRNRPSIGFLTAFTAHFSEIDPRWLLHGKGDMITDVTIVSSDKEKPEVSSPPSMDTSVSNNKNTPVTLPDKDEGKAIDRIVIFYSDGTFKTYVS